MENNGFIGSKGHDQLMSWDMFNQNSSASFFDPEWMFGLEEGFDIVIANPPYVSSKDLSEGAKKVYKKIYKTAVKQFDLYSLFIEKCMSVLSDNGITSYIVPDSLIGRSNFSATRKILVLDNTILGWVHLNNVFEEAVVSSLIYVCKKEKSDAYEFVYTKADNVKHWKTGIYQSLNIQKSSIVKDSHYKVYFANSTNISLQQKLMSVSTFKDNCRIWRGEEIGKNCDFLLDSYYPGGLPLITGSEAKRYQIIESTKWILERDVDKDIQDYKVNKILIRQVGSCINATINLNQGVTTQSVYSLYPTNQEHRNYLFALVGILNSKLFDFFYRLVSGDKQLFKRIILENIKALPFPNMKSPYIEKIDSIVRDMYQNDFNNFEDAEKNIDFYTYKLYNLSYEEILISDSATSITREEYENFKLD